MPSIACSFNVFNEALALPGMLESASSFFDNLYCIHASPDGKPSTDGTIEILEKWGIKPVMEDISQGFGSIRTKLVHNCGCDWAYIMDADERFHAYAPILKFDGTEKYPDSKNPNVTAMVVGASYSQGSLLRSMIEAADGFDAIVCRRRHWMDFSWKHPAQNADSIPDWQCRVVKNSPLIGFDPKWKLHEKIVNLSTGREPEMIRQTMNPRAVFFDHYHNFFKPRHAEKNREDMNTYKMLDEQNSRGMWLESAAGVTS